MSGSLFTSWIKNAAAIRFGVTTEELDNPGRSATIARARVIAMALTRELFPFVSYPEIGRSFGNRDHTTAMSACQRTKEKILTDEMWRADYEAVKKLAIEMMPEDRRPTE